MVEKTLIQQKIGHIEQNLRKLETLANLPKEEFLKESDSPGRAYRFPGIH